MYTLKKPIIEIYDKQFNKIEYTDDFVSLIWTDRYNDIGEFELVLPINSNVANIYKNGFFIKRNDRENICYVESIEQSYESLTGSKIKITGRDTVNIINQRAIYNSHQYNDKAADEIISEIFQENISFPTNSLRGIAQIHDLSVNDNALYDLYEKIDFETGHDQVLDKIIDILKHCKLGIRSSLYPNDQQTNNSFKYSILYEIYKGTDRSKTAVNKYLSAVVFSPKLDNIKSISYLKDISGYKNCAYAEGKYETAVKTSPELYEIMEVSMFAEAGFGKGIDRFEEYVDASDVDKTVNDIELSNSAFKDAIKQKGIEDLNEKDELFLLDCEVYPNNIEYCKDYFIGDIVSIDTATGINGDVRIAEVVENFDTNGYSVALTFEFLRYSLDDLQIESNWYEPWNDGVDLLTENSDEILT